MTPDRILGAARALVADPNNLEVRGDFVRATFNLDRTAAAIIALAEAEPPPSNPKPES